MKFKFIINGGFMKYLFVILSVFLIMKGCKNDTLINPINDNQVNSKKLIKAKIDFQVGFAGRSVSIILNNESIYNSILSEEVSLSGPEASFITYLPKGENKLMVFAQNPSNHSEFIIDSSNVHIGDKNEYFIGLQINDSLRCTI